jgi:release factor glutamine methyltransferase
VSRSIPSPGPSRGREGRQTIRDLLAPARARLAALPFAGAREAHLLLGHVLGLSEASLLARDDEAVAPDAEGRFAELVERRAAGEPVAYLTGTKEFWGRSFAVDARVLVPRPETEHLVEAALALAPSLDPHPRILDLGTGSGAIAVTLALELPHARVVATDRSATALSLARRNARQLGARVGFVAADWAAALSASSFDLVVSNPPYLDPGGDVQPEVARWEPEGALLAGSGGLDAYRALLSSVATARRGTRMLLEIGAGQAQALDTLAGANGWRLAEVRRDLAGLDRVVALRRS